jgi:hypothetical protein
MQPQYGISPQGDVLAFISTWEERIQGQPGRPWQLVLPILQAVVVYWYLQAPVGSTREECRRAAALA